MAQAKLGDNPSKSKYRKVEEMEGERMKKIWRLRRQGVLLMTLGLGLFLGNISPIVSKGSIALIIVLYIVWLLFYDFAMTEWSGKNVYSSGSEYSQDLHKGQEKEGRVERVTSNVSRYENIR